MTNEQIIYNEALSNNMPALMAAFITAQAKHETNNFTSNIFITCNNAFGYKYVGQSLSAGPCNISPEGNAYAKYATINDSVKEICSWIKRRQQENNFPADLREIKTVEQYAFLLKMSGYYGDTLANYSAGLAYWFKANIRPIAAGGLLVVSLLIFFLITKYTAR